MVADKQLKPGRSKIDETKEFLEANIIGQPQAIKRVCKVVATKISGLTFRNRPLGMIFTGPPAVGKTLTAQKLAESLGGNFIEIDMTEFVEDWKASKILGTGPGIVFGKPLITPDKLSKDFTKPTVILLDEFEKAHIDIRKIFIGILDDGKLSIYLQSKEDKKKGIPYPETIPVDLDFSNCIMIFTSNAGSEKIAVEQSGGGVGYKITSARKTLSHEQVADMVWPELKKVFGPELMSRIGEKRTVAFNELTNDDITTIINLRLKELVLNSFTRHNFSIVIDPEVNSMIFSRVREFPELGARNVQDVIESEITNQIANGLLSAEDNSDDDVVTKIHPGDIVKLGVKHSKKVIKGICADDKEVEIVGVDITNRQNFTEVSAGDISAERQKETSPVDTEESHEETSDDDDSEENTDELTTRIVDFITSVLSFWATQSLQQWRHSLIKIIRENADEMEPELLARIFGDLYNFTIQFGPPRLSQFKQESKDKIVMSFMKMITGSKPSDACGEEINKVLSEELNLPDKTPDEPPPKKRAKKQ